jgi:hypothetical protein
MDVVTTLHPRKGAALVVPSVNCVPPAGTSGPPVRSIVLVKPVVPGPSVQIGSSSVPSVGAQELRAQTRLPCVG